LFDPMTVDRRQAHRVAGSGVLAVTTALLLGACTGASKQIVFDHVAYPVSLSPVVPDRDGLFVQVEEQEILGELWLEERLWSANLLWWWVGTVDLSSNVNEQVRRSGGEAVVNLQLTTRLPFAPDVMPGLLYLCWIPFWPGSVIVEVKGDIVRSTRTISQVTPTFVEQP
jgi:hypothetical protein